MRHVSGVTGGRARERLHIFVNYPRSCVKPLPFAMGI
jgi:hypothetical protein